MKKSVVIITVVFVLIALSCVCANAEEGEMIYDMSNVFDSLSDDIKQSLQNMGVDLGDFSKLANLSFENEWAKFSRLHSATFLHRSKVLSI